MEDMSNPIIGCVLGEHGKHIAKMEFIKGCGCSGNNCVDIKSQQSLFIPKERIRQCVKSKRVIKSFSWFATLAVFATSYVMWSMPKDKFIINIALVMFILFITSVLLHFIDGIVLGNCCNFAKTFSKIREEYCNGCLVYPTCSTACNDFCTHLGRECFRTNTPVAKLPLLGAAKTFKYIEDTVSNYIKFL